MHIPNLLSRGALKATLITLSFVLTDDLQISVLNLLLDTVLFFTVPALISYLDRNKHSSVVEHINWVLSESSVGVHKMLNGIDRTCMSPVEHIYFHAFYKKCGL